MKPPARFAPIESRRAFGRSLRATLHRVDQSNAAVPPRDALAILKRADVGKLKSLLPIKVERMSESPFAFFRGSVALMAFDLSDLPTTGIEPQICGDAHLRNMGAYAGPDGRIVFDINDFDETCRGPWEWDLKRLATSIVLAAREANHSEKSSRAAVQTFVRAYRRSLRLFEEMPALELARWEIRRGDACEPIEATLRAAESATPKDTLKKLTVPAANGERRFRHAPPLLTRLRAGEASGVLNALKSYRSTLGPGRQSIFDLLRPVDVAFKVVGTGSVGSRNYAILCYGNGPSDPVFLQMKEARVSTYAATLKGARVKHQGERVATGQHRMQSARDPLLGWTRMGGRDYLVRQLADHKASIDLTKLGPSDLVAYAAVAGELFAKAHARTADAAVLVGYIGDSTKLDTAIARFAENYADHVDRDFTTFLKANRTLRL